MSWTFCVSISVFFRSCAPRACVRVCFIQAKDQDPSGEFIKRWVPELRGVPVPRLFEPWKLPPAAQAAAGIRIVRPPPPPPVTATTPQALVAGDSGAVLGLRELMRRAASRATAASGTPWTRTGGAVAAAASDMAGESMCADEEGLPDSERGSYTEVARGSAAAATTTAEYPYPIVDEAGTARAARDAFGRVLRQLRTREEAQKVFLKHGSRKPPTPGRGHASARLLPPASAPIRLHCSESDVVAVEDDNTGGGCHELSPCMSAGGASASAVKDAGGRAAVNLTSPRIFESLRGRGGRALGMQHGGTGEVVWGQRRRREGAADVFGVEDVELEPMAAGPAKRRRSSVPSVPRRGKLTDRAAGGRGLQLASQRSVLEYFRSGSSAVDAESSPQTVLTASHVAN